MKLDPQKIGLQERFISITEFEQRTGIEVLVEAEDFHILNPNNLLLFSEVIESILLGIPQHQFVFVLYDRKIIVGDLLVDAIKNFVENKFQIIYPNYLHMLDKKYFKELEPHLQRTILEFQIKVFIAHDDTPVDIIEDLKARFKRPL